MPCYYPIAAYRAINAQTLELYSRKQAHLYRNKPGEHLELPCGQCSGCRRRRSLEWATRCLHEAQMHRHNCYITLTYNDQALPPGANLRHRDFVLFVKKIRNYLARRNTRAGNSRTQVKTENLLSENNKVRFYMAGEYGEHTGRPHYHALLFGLDFADKILLKTTPAREHIYRSATLEQLWPHGYSSIGELTFNSAAYVARYVMKKRTGDKNKKHYEIINPETAEIHFRPKEYNCMSRKPGIAASWLQRYSTDIWTLDQVVTKQGRILRPPRFYDKQLKRENRELYDKTKHARQLTARARAHDHTDDRLAVQELVANATTRRQTRNFH